ncbi:MAG: AAA family ATPase, partial [Planctomycetota bacterium]
MRRIAFMNQKGGVGKTTTVANLGAAFATLGRRVLVIDVDPQANLSTHLDFDLDSGVPTIYEVLTRRLELADAIVETKTPGLSLLPSSIDLSGAEIELVQEMGRETILKGAVDDHVASLPEDQRPEFVLVDCPPSLGLLSLNALTTVTEVMIPIQTQFFALRGMSKLLEVVKLVQERLNPRLELTAIIPSIADLRTNLTGEVIQEIKRYFGAKVTRTIIRTNIRLAEAPSFGQSIFDYDRSARGAKDFLRLAKELLGDLPADIGDLDPGRAPEREPEATEPEPEATEP